MGRRKPSKLAPGWASGRYRIVGRDGAFWLTDIKYNEE